MTHSSRFEQLPMFDLQSAIKSLARTAPVKPKVKSIPVLKEQLKHYCDIFTEGPICLGDGSRIISKALNMDGIIGDFNFNQKIVRCLAHDRT